MRRLNVFLSEEQLEQRRRQELLDESWFNLTVAQTRLGLETRRHLSFRGALFPSIETRGTYRSAYLDYMQVNLNDPNGPMTRSGFSELVMKLTVKRQNELSEAINWMPRRQRIGNTVLSLRGKPVNPRQSITIASDMSLQQQLLEGLILQTNADLPTEQCHLEAAGMLLSDQMEFEVRIMESIREKRFPQPPLPPISGLPLGF